MSDDVDMARIHKMSAAAHDAQCESELTSHGYTPCRCGERADPAERAMHTLIDALADLDKALIDCPDLRRAWELNRMLREAWLNVDRVKCRAADLVENLTQKATA